MIHRVATLLDLPELAELERRCFPGDAWNEASLGAEVQRPGTLFRVIEVEGRVVASALGWWILDEVEVMRVAVHPDAQRRGLGRQVLQDLEQARPDLEYALLEVRDDNHAAIHLYESTGYVQDGLRPRYYSDGCDARLYRKKLR
jgi:[ribosomal protein S18]-alanine N-acetyltransferase